MLQLTNTLTRNKEEFIPLDPNRVTFYHCGPTVYWTQHLGNMRAVVMADVVVRTLEYLGYDVKMVRNYTDVGHLTGDNIGDADQGEDRMEKAAKRENKTPEEIADKYRKIYDQHVELLNIRQPDNRPKATDHIPEIIGMVKKLFDKGFAYLTDLAVYFDVSKAKDYTRLSKQKFELNIAEAGKGDVSDPNKKHSADFALWFFKAGVHAHALQTWPSPFVSRLVQNGEGFPGWHIECSAMAKKYLGDTLDLHMGGVEHIPIHHTNEIAQSESTNGKPFVRYWLHNEHLMVDNKKMAKSEGTGYSLDEVIEQQFGPMELRYFFLTAHYRSKQNFTWEALGGALAALNKLYDAVRNYQSENINQKSKAAEQYLYSTKFQEALEDDFNTPKALAVVWDLIKSDISSSEKLSSLLKFDQVLGLKLDQVKPVEIPEAVKKLILDRAEARRKKDFKTSDELRKRIEEAGFLIEDVPNGVRILRN